MSKYRKSFQMSLLDNITPPVGDNITTFVAGLIPLLEPEEKPSIYDGQLFETITFPGPGPHERGRIGQEIVALLARSYGFTHEHRHTNGKDAIINGINVEVKRASESEKHSFQLNQIRDQEYAFLVAVIIRPHLAQIFTIPKALVIEKATGQHGGKDAVETMIFKTPDYYTFRKTFQPYAGPTVFRDTFKLEE